MDVSMRVEGDSVPGIQENRQPAAATVLSTWLLSVVGASSETAGR